MESVRQQNLHRLRIEIELCQARAQAGKCRRPGINTSAGCGHQRHTTVAQVGGSGIGPSQGLGHERRAITAEVRRSKVGASKGPGDAEMNLRLDQVAPCRIAEVEKKTLAQLRINLRVEAIQALTKKSHQFIEGSPVLRTHL